MSTSLNVSLPKRKRRDINEILGRERMQKALSLQEAEQVGTHIPTQGHISDADRQVYLEAGLNYDHAQEVLDQIKRLSLILKTYQTLNSIFQLNSGKIKELDSKIQELKASIS